MTRPRNRQIAIGPALQTLGELLQLGDLDRLTCDAVADLLLGLSTVTTHQGPQVFGVELQAGPLPETELCKPWPPRTNRYTKRGELEDAASALSAPIAQVGYLLTRSEVRAALLGLVRAPGLDCAGLQRLIDTFDRLAHGALQDLQGKISILESRSTTSTTLVISTGLPQARIVGAGRHGDVIRRRADGDIEVATGDTVPDQETVIGLLGQDWSDGQLATYYPTGTKAPPLAILSPGRLYRAVDGAAVNYNFPPLQDQATKVVGVSSAAGIDVLIDSNDIQVTSP